MSSKLKFLTYKKICFINKIKHDDIIEKKYSDVKKVVEDFIEKHEDGSFYKIVRFLNTYHSGLRKGGKIPELEHFLNISYDIILLDDYISSYGYSTIEIVKIALLHDLYEDYGKHDKIWDEDCKRLKHKSKITKDVLDYITEDKVISDKVLSLSKIDHLGKQKKSKKYYGKISEDFCLIVVKMLDRKDSLTSMYGVFSEEKKEVYIEQYEKYIKFLSDKIEKKEDKLSSLFMIIRYKISLILKR